ncbi:proton-conducting transporter membrane subunit [Micromonospora aurantiaca]|jgi:NADH:ubiquinone oxidoreductase subunit 5 (subunit L)/multisubunit Na+/H+ antiporter MnhA subunit|uniref:NADH-quinone oxidoreductase subunit L n=1 Tax=Micromonospora aurantiaca (nom. illeg.) TaxID=47850 RepID=A0A1C6TNH3_9ACTN|nr:MULTISPECIES: proton-conducting transporter membrane subunit [Micromonospora]ADU09726.1 NADH/Ubiquinone/plastoquinone (complex I) [Micromonospora sp. L5]AXH93642.1 NADH-quinone oxidoreductase subunit L [Micromonospora aurantiaca]KAB1118660.1 NADH-quinone oxidoreductase subunit L [Micromonospora aurantiaca]MBC8990226.1 NADH-quinone oxidoreductase subunit L [Micromonospora chalcea]MCT2281810.1 NADH-quinone oxidoreductase subunit L [Micromonospora chalcea]
MNGLAQAALWSLVALPAGVGALLAFDRRADRLAAPVALTVATGSVALSAVVGVARPRVAAPFLAGTEFALAVDGLAALVLPMLTVVTLLVLLAAAGEIRRSRARFHGLMLLFAASVALTATAATLPTLLFAWEIMGAASYALIGFWWRDSDRVSAGLTAFVTTRAADLGLYLAAGAALAGGAGLALRDLPDSSPGWRHLIAAGMLIAALGKAAQLPFSFWLSRAMAGPSPVSALLHSAAMVAMGGYLLLRVEPLLATTGWAGPATMWAGAVTALLLGAVAVAQRDLKQLLAASTSAQLGFVVLAAGAGGIAGGATHLIAHAATKALLFLAAGAWLTALGTKQLAGLRGVVARWPWVGWTATVGALALAGMAPLSLWATKDEVLAAALEQSPWLYAVGLAASALSAAYAGKVLVVIWRRVPPDQQADVDAHRDEEETATRRVGVLQQAPLVALAIGAGFAGLLALPPVGATVARTVGQPEKFHVSLPELGVSAVIALVVVLAVARRPIPEPRWALHWLGLEPAARVLVVRPTLRCAEALARFDDRVLDRAAVALARTVLSLSRRAGSFDDRVLDRGVEFASARTLRMAARAGRADDRWLDGAVEAFAAGMRRLGQFARRPQTGQLYQYYLQAVVVLLVGVVVLVVLG